MCALVVTQHGDPSHGLDTTGQYTFYNGKPTHPPGRRVSRLNCHGMQNSTCEVTIHHAFLPLLGRGHCQFATGTEEAFLQHLKRVVVTPAVCPPRLFQSFWDRPHQRNVLFPKAMHTTYHLHFTASGYLGRFGKGGPIRVGRYFFPAP